MPIRITSTDPYQTRVLLSTGELRPVSTMRLDRVARAFQSQTAHNGAMRGFPVHGWRERGNTACRCTDCRK